jgi:ankyrin repeat protein
LCDRGADAEARDNEGWRPLHYAAFYGHITVVKELIEERNADINARNDSGQTALRFARRYYKHVAAYLVSRGGLDLGVSENENDDDGLDFDGDD